MDGAPVLVNPIPAQVINEGASYGPFDLKQFIQVPQGAAPANFKVALKGGGDLPAGLICTADGVLTGIPGEATHGNYEVVITADNGTGSVQAAFMLSVKPSMEMGANEYLDQMKAQIWEALEQNMPIPDLGDIYNRPVSPIEIYYLLERWGTLTMWDAFNLDPPSEKRLLTLENANAHFHIYDRGSCIVGVPKDLFSCERTLADGLQTSRVMAAEVYKRGWTVQMAGFDKYVRAAWVEIQHLSDKFGKSLEVINFNPRPEDARIYTVQATNRRGMG